MLHVILFILKAIGILLVSVLGLILILCLIILLSPIRYQVQAEKYEDIFIRLKAGWLSRVLYFKMAYEKETLSYQMWICGFIFRDSDKPRKEKKKKNKKTKAKKEAMPLKAPVKEKKETPVTEPDNVRDNPVIKENPDKPETEPQNEQKFLKTSIFYKIKYKIKAVIHSIKATMNKVKSIPKNISSHFLKILQNLIFIKDFIQDEVNKKGIKDIWISTKKILKHLLPIKIRADVKFGTGDPCSTGQILAFVSLTYHLYQDSVHIIPDFEESVIEGQIIIKGRIRLGTLLIIIIKLMINKDFKQLVKNYKKLKEEL